MNLNESREYKDKFIAEIKRLRESKDLLAENYVNLDHTYSEYPIFHCLFKKESLVAFSGVQTKFFPEGTCRFLTRFYISPSYRGRKEYTLTGGKPSVLTKVMLRAQIQWAKSQGMKTGFISMQSLKRRAYLKQWVKMRNMNPGFGEWRAHEEMYLTCPFPEAKDCWQLVASTSLCAKKGGGLNIPSMSINEYLRKFE